jgi:hypothetical protein
MWAKIGTWILDYLIKRLQSWLSALIDQKVKTKKQDAQAVKAAEEFKEVVNDPTKTREDRKRAEDTFLNS